MAAKKASQTPARTTTTKIKSTKSHASKKEIRVGVLGVARGSTFARQAEHAGMKLVAVCDIWKERLDALGKEYPDITTYESFDDFLEHDMDAVVLANFCNDHAPFAIKALERGLHVMSEVIAVRTLGQAVDLVEAVEKSGKVYMMAENYCYFNYNQEMRRLYQAGEIGEVQFAECEYIHPEPARVLCQLGPGTQHWRNWNPSTYYPTHALGPIMYITDRRPVSVNARAVAYSKADAEYENYPKCGDNGSHILCTMDNGSVTIVNGIGLRGHGNWYRLHGTRGRMENLRTHGEQGKLRITHEYFDMKPGDVTEKIYLPEFPVHADLANKAGHGGGDFFTSFYFAEAIRTGTQPWLDIYRSLDMSIVAIQAWKSCLDNGNNYEVPDFRTKEAREKYRGEMWSPFPEDADKAPNQPPPSINGFKKPTKKSLAFARKVWDEMGYHGT